MSGCLEHLGILIKFQLSLCSIYSNHFQYELINNWSMNTLCAMVMLKMCTKEVYNEECLRVQLQNRSALGFLCHFLKILHKIWKKGTSTALRRAVWMNYSISCREVWDVLRRKRCLKHTRMGERYSANNDETLYGCMCVNKLNSDRISSYYHKVFIRLNRNIRYRQEVINSVITESI